MEEDPCGPSGQSQVSALSARLTRRYAAVLPDRLAELRRTVESARGGAAASLEQARNMAHRVRGTAASYGFIEVGDVVEAIERLLEKGGAIDWRGIEGALNRAERAAEGEIERVLASLSARRSPGGD